MRFIGGQLDRTKRRTHPYRQILKFSEIVKGIYECFSFHPQYQIKTEGAESR